MFLDHLAVSGETLEMAVAHVEEALGVALQPGGKHVHFGTHNALLGLSDGLYLEAIAIDPEARPPQSARWFDLDRFSGAPRLGNWICRSEDLAQLLGKVPPGAGDPVDLQRGDLRWQMAVPATGILPFDNLFPALMQWQGRHPAAQLKQQGCRLEMLHVGHPLYSDLADAIARAGFADERVRFETASEPRLTAEIMTPHGLRLLA